MSARQLGHSSIQQLQWCGLVRCFRRAELVVEGFWTLFSEIKGELGVLQALICGFLEVNGQHISLNFNLVYNGA